MTSLPQTVQLHLRVEAVGHASHLCIYSCIYTLKIHRCIWEFNTYLLFSKISLKWKLNTTSCIRNFFSNLIITQYSTVWFYNRKTCPFAMKFCIKFTQALSDQQWMEIRIWSVRLRQKIVAPAATSSQTVKGNEKFLCCCVWE